MVDVLLLCREHDTQVVELAVRGALAAGAHDGRAVKLLVDRSARPQPAALQIDAKLQGIGSPPPTASDISGYDRCAIGGRTRSCPGPYCHAEAFIEQDQIDCMGDGFLCQLVTMILLDDTGEVEPAACALTAEQARLARWLSNPEPKPDSIAWQDRSKTWKPPLALARTDPSSHDARNRSRPSVSHQPARSAGMDGSQGRS